MLYFFELVSYRIDKITPAMTAAVYNKPVIFKFSLGFLFTRKRTIRPIPALVQRPATTEAKERAPLKYNSVNRTEAAQFGINPMSAARKG